MTRRCSHCSNDGHNSPTCPTLTGGAGATVGGGVRLFGVTLTEGGSTIMKKSASVGCLTHCAGSAGLSPSASGSPGRQLDSTSSDPQGDNDDRDAEEYASDDPNHASCTANLRAVRKKGTHWTEEEHRMFLVGLQELGKRDWHAIARKYVVSRTPTQVSSHAQKYFSRQSNASRRKRRSSLLDVARDMPMDQVPATEDRFERSPPQSDSANSMPSLDITLAPDSMIVEPVTTPPLMPTYYRLYPVPYPFWPSRKSVPVKEDAKTHEVLKPTPVLADETKTNELLGLCKLTKLSLGEVGGSCPQPSKLLSDSSSMESVFHESPADAGSDL